ncbi:MAG: hypothetical protein NVS9B15_11870 [Acidobacteriaceae bacterium]
MLCIRAAVNNRPKAGASHAQVGRYSTGRSSNAAKQLFILFTGVRKSREMLARNDQDVDRRHGLYIPEGDDRIVLVHDLGRDLSTCDLTK